MSQMPLLLNPLGLSDYRRRGTAASTDESLRVCTAEEGPAEGELICS
jgi:hypothetical protein